VQTTATPQRRGGRIELFIGADFADVRGRWLAQLEFLRFTDCIFKGLFCLIKRLGDMGLKSSFLKRKKEKEQNQAVLCDLFA